jgi:hypothetical protein
MDNGPELTSRALDQWAYARGVRLHFIDRGKPVQNCFVESFNGTLRHECLNDHWFTSLYDAREKVETWRVDYNRVRPHQSLGDRTPEEFRAAAAASLEEGVQRGSTAHVTEEQDPAGVRGAYASYQKTRIDPGLETGARPRPAILSQ